MPKLSKKEKLYAYNAGINNANKQITNYRKEHTLLRTSNYLDKELKDDYSYYKKCSKSKDKCYIAGQIDAKAYYSKQLNNKNWYGIKLYKKRNVKKLPDHLA